MFNKLCICDSVVSKLYVFLGLLCVACRAYWEWGVGEEPNHTAAKKRGPLEIIKHTLVGAKPERVFFSRSSFYYANGKNISPHHSSLTSLYGKSFAEIQLVRILE